MANEIFSPSEKEVTKAQRILDAMAEGQREIVVGRRHQRVQPLGARLQPARDRQCYSH